MKFHFLLQQKVSKPHVKTEFKIDLSGAEIHDLMVEFFKQYSHLKGLEYEYIPGKVVFKQYDYDNKDI